MIQRVQTLLLAGALICHLALFTSGIAVWDSGDNSGYQLSVQSVTLGEQQTYNWPLIAVNGIIIVLLIVAIFGFRNRKRQAGFCLYIMILEVLLGAGCFYYFNLIGKTALQGAVAGPGIVFLILPLILTALARYYILKDEALVRSADRLR
jgi:hypothetical protein